jgi:hypothetical protein
MQPDQPFNTNLKFDISLPTFPIIVKTADNMNPELVLDKGKAKESEPNEPAKQPIAFTAPTNEDVNMTDINTTNEN